MSSSTEASSSNPTIRSDSLFGEQRECSIESARGPKQTRAMRKYLETFSRPLFTKTGEVFAMKELLTSMMRNPVQGVRGHRPRSTCPAWGVSSLATDRTAGDLLRGSLANPATTNSSTTKGPRGLAGELCRRRSRIANGFGWWVRGCFYVRPSEMIAELLVATCNRNYAGSGELDIQPNPLPVTRDSDVIRKVKDLTNAGSSAAAGVVSGAWTWAFMAHESSRCFKRRRVGVWPD